MRAVLVLLLVAMTAAAHGAEKKAKRQPQLSTLEQKWSQDRSMIPLGSNVDFKFYGIKKTALISAEDSNYRSAWVALLFTARGRTSLHGKNRGAYYSKEKWVFNCATGTINYASVNYFSKDGHLIASYGNDNLWDDIVPGSVAALAAKIVCSIDKAPSPPPKDTPVASPDSNPPSDSARPAL